MPAHIYGFMFYCMKTTVELPDELLIRAKKRAAELRRPLRMLVADGLCTQLATRGRAAPAARAKRLRWVTVNGGLPPGVDVASRVKMHEWLRRQS